MHKNKRLNNCVVPPTPCLKVCDEAAADSTVPRLQWPPALHTAQLSPGASWPSPDPIARPSHRSDPLHGTAPSQGGPGSGGRRSGIYSTNETNLNQ